MAAHPLPKTLSLIPAYVCVSSLFLESYCLILTPSPKRAQDKQIACLALVLALLCISNKHTAAPSRGGILIRKCPWGLLLELPLELILYAHCKLEQIKAIRRSRRCRKNREFFELLRNYKYLPFSRANGFLSFSLWDCYAVLPSHWLSVCFSARHSVCFEPIKVPASCVRLRLMAKCTLLPAILWGGGGARWHVGFDFLLPCFVWSAARNYGKIIASTVCHPRQPTKQAYWLCLCSGSRRGNSKANIKATSPQKPILPLAIRPCFSLCRLLLGP